MKRYTNVRVVGVSVCGLHHWDFNTIDGALSFVAYQSRNGTVTRNAYLCISGLHRECKHFRLPPINTLCRRYPMQTEIAGRR